MKLTKKISMLILAGMLVLGGCGNSSDAPAASGDEGTGSSGAEGAGPSGAQASQAENSSGETIEVAVDFADIRLENFKSILESFEKDTGITVELTALGTDYDSIMKTRMASNDLPDVWSTHGWSVMRYSDYLRVLNDQPWYSSVTDDALGVIANKEGNIFVLPASIGVSAIMYNADVLEKAGVAPEEILTTADFEEACEKIKATGVTPIFIGGKDASNGAGFLNTYLFPMMLINDGAAYPSADTLTDGTFDWQQYGTQVMQKFAQYVRAGYFNENYTTADTREMQTALGEGRCAFMVRGTLNLATAKSYVPDANLGIIPVPSYSENGKSMFQVGESLCLGVWKDTEKEEAALKLLDYIATQNLIPSICETEGAVPGLKDIEISDSYATDAYFTATEQFSNRLMYDNVFDRKYFPSGMWSIMGEAATAIAMDPSDEGVKAAVDLLEENYQTKYEEAHQN